MNAPLRHHARQGALVDPVEVLRARAEARASLWAAGACTLHTAIDQLWHDAECEGLVDRLGVDACQKLIADCFWPCREGLECEREILPAHEAEAKCLAAQIRASEVISEDDPWDDPGWEEAAREYHAKRGSNVSEVDYSPDELARLRRLMADDVSLDRAWRELDSERARAEVPEVTLKAAEYLHDLGDLNCFKKWFDRHTTEERAAIFRHLDERKRGRGK
jgi:hypothetical protein